MGLQKETILSYGIKVSYDEVVSFLSNLGDQSFEEEFWFEYIDEFFETLGIDYSKYSDGPYEVDESIYLGIIHDIDVDKAFDVNPYILIAAYKRIYTEEIKQKLFPLFEGKEEKLLVRVLYK